MTYKEQVKADRRAAALERASELAKTGSNEIRERQALYSGNN